MEYYLSIGGLSICFITPLPLIPEEAFLPFLSTSCTGTADVEITFSQDFHSAPSLSFPPVGEDILLRYYLPGDSLVCEALGGPRGPLSIAVGSADCARWTCYLNTGIHQPPNTLSNLMRLIPMHIILQRKNVLFFHASQIEVQGRGVLFTAPSGTGKTTQAKLWKKYRGAKIICNDRTLIRSGFTYGYPADGSEPVRSSEVYPLGAIVLLKQSRENRVYRLKPSMALAKLMPQIVFSSWSPEAVNMASAQLLDLITSYPVLQLECTPDEDAVACLEKSLQEEGVIK